MVEKSNALPKLRVLNTFTGQKVSALSAIYTIARMNSFLWTPMKSPGTLVAPPSTTTPTWDMPELICRLTSSAESCLNSSATISR